jgi:bifunctional non-homologous end joining protein LigD
MSEELAGIAITHPERVVYPEPRITKLDLARYYEIVARRMLPHVVGRPLTLYRCPGGLQKSCFYQKHVGPGMPDAIQGVEIDEANGARGTYPMIMGLPGLVALVQMGVLEIHLSGARADDVERPDRIVFDIDPDVGLPFSRVVEAALAIRAKLVSLGLRSWVKTTGGKGLHVVVPIVREHDWDVVHGFSKGVAESLVRESPAAYTVNALKVRRRGRIFIDYLRNGRGATAIAPYSTRARAGATVATPISWTALTKGIDPSDFTAVTLPSRLAGSTRDPWTGFLTLRQRLSTKALSAP